MVLPAGVRAGVCTAAAAAAGGRKLRVIGPGAATRPRAAERQEPSGRDARRPGYQTLFRKHRLTVLQMLKGPVSFTV